MAAQIQQQFIAQLDEVLKNFQDLRSRGACDDGSDLPDHEATSFVTRARAAIHRIAGRPSVYVDQCEEILDEPRKRWPGYKAYLLASVVGSLRADIEAGYLKSYTELTHSELFADFLEMSNHLLDEGYKDAAAVIAGSSLEAHLRQLCQKAGIDTEAKTATGRSPKKADRLNSDLAGAKIYTKLDEKNVTAWLGLRNKAAHGQYDEYQNGQVALLISAVQDFITRNPALATAGI